MTREEAIKVLSSYDVNDVWADVDGKPYNAEEQAEAFDMAIEALKQVTGKLKKTDDSLLTADPEACKEQKSKLNLISRQAAIDAINSHFGFNIEEEYGSAVQEVINGLPSAQPETHEERTKNARKRMACV